MYRETFRFEQVIIIYLRKLFGEQSLRARNYYKQQQKIKSILKKRNCHIEKHHPKKQRIRKLYIDSPA